MPVFNEEEIVEKTVRDFHREIIRKIPGSEFIIVDDCSADSTPQILAKLAGELPELRILRPARNGGHGKALRLGMENSKCDWVFHADSDYQNDPTDFWKLVQKAADNDLVIGYRQQRQDPFLRLAVTRGVRLVNLFLFGVYLRDANSPFKLVRKNCLDSCLREIDREAFAPSILLASVARYRGYRVEEVPVRHLPRLTGVCSIRKWKLAKACMRTFWEILSIRLRTRRHRG